MTDELLQKLQGLVRQMYGAVDECEEALENDIYNGEEECIGNELTTGSGCWETLVGVLDALAKLVGVRIETDRVASDKPGDVPSDLPSADEFCRRQEAEREAGKVKHVD